MSGLIERVRARTWSRSFLAKAAVGILVGGVAIAALAGALRPSRTSERPIVPESLGLFGADRAEDLPAPETWLDPWLASEDTDFSDVLDAIPWLVGQPAARGTAGVLAALERSIANPPRRELATLSLRARTGDAEALERLAQLARDETRHANHALGLLLPPSALRGSAFEREARLHGGDAARRHALETYVALGDEQELARLLDDPAYARVADARIPYSLAVQRLDWAGIFLWMMPAQHARVSPSFVALGVASGIVWLVFLAYAGDVRSWKSSRLLLCVVALVLGALSTVPTLVASVWMDEVLGVDAPRGLVPGVAYYVASVGLREELCKLLAFLLLAPIVIRRGDPLEMLVVAGCVGLGFAAEENISYFSRSGGGDAAGRFLSANFGHVVDTGLIGAAFCRMFIRERGTRDGERNPFTDFALIFVAIVIGHGVYDALILVPELESYGPLSGTIYVAVAYFFFGELRSRTPRGKRPVSLTAVFVLGFATLLALTLVASSFELGLGTALQVIIPGTLGALLFVFVFFRQIDEPLLP